MGLSLAYCDLNSVIHGYLVVDTDSDIQAQVVQGD